MKKTLQWFKLDYAASFYPILTTRNTQSIFRLSALLDEKVEPEKLRQALCEAIVRFPLFKVRQRTGVFWYYFEENEEPFNIFEDDGILLRRIDTKKTNGYQFRLCYFGKKIALDIFHGLTDGVGALVFFKAILYKYSLLTGHKPVGGKVINFGEEITPDELEDSFSRYALKTKLKDLGLDRFTGKSPMITKGHHFVGAGYGTITGEISASQLKETAKKYGCTLTQYLCAVLSYAFITRSKKKNKPFVLMLPVNFRVQFPSKSLKNFVSFVKICVNPKEVETFEDMVQKVKEQMEKVMTKQEMQNLINTTVKGQSLPFFKFLVLPLKYLFIRIGKIFYKARHTVIFSNLGVTELPEDMGVDKIIFNLNVSKNNPVNCAAVTTGDKLMITFTRTIVETEIERLFFTKMVSDGVKVSVMSNFREEQNVL